MARQAALATRAIDFRRNIGDEGLSHLCRALRTNQTLRTLHLDERMLTDAPSPAGDWPVEQRDLQDA